MEIQARLGLWAFLNWPSLREAFLMRDSGKQELAEAKLSPVPGGQGGGRGRQGEPDSNALILSFAPTWPPFSGLHRSL